MEELSQFSPPYLVASSGTSFPDSGMDVPSNVTRTIEELLEGDPGRIVEMFPKWNVLPSEECEFLKSTNGSLWLLLNRYSNLTTGFPVRCLEHAPTLDLSNTVQAITLGVMFVVSLVGNTLTAYSLSHKSRTKRYASSVYRLIFHLSIADLLVTVTCLFGEAAWSYSVSWLADNFTCKLFKFLQVFSLYLSTFVLVLIGLDRLIAVKYPMKALGRRRTCSRLVLTAWILSLVLSVPQFLIFRVGKGPFYEDFYQCVTYGFYTEAWQEQLYTVSSLFLMFILPLVIIVWSYVSTFIALTQSEKKFRAEVESERFLSPELNRRRLIHRARTKSMRISLVIVVAFIICWTPYYFMMIVFMFHEPDEELARDLRNGIFCFGMSNSVINPMIYGAFHLWKPRGRMRCKSSRRRNETRKTRIAGGGVYPKPSITSMVSVHSCDLSALGSIRQTTIIGGGRHVLC